MGTCYYLWRADNRTGYELGKAWHLHKVFGDTPQIVTDGDALAELIATVLPTS